MAYTTVLVNIPSKLTAGESVSWSVSLSDYPASESWVLTYTLVKSDTKISIVATDDGDDDLVEIPHTTSDDYGVGEYLYQAHVSNGTERYQVDSGSIEIVTDYAAQDSGYDGRSHVKKVLDALMAAIEGRASKTQLSQKVGDVQIQHMALDDLFRAKDRYTAEYNKEQVRAGNKKSRRTIKTRFSAVS